MEFRLTAIRRPSFPRLAWVSVLSSGNRELQVHLGSCVEETPSWIIEGAWDGPFEAGEFDRTSALFGTGVRLRESEVVFASSATMLDRLWVYQSSEKYFYIGNSLPAVLAVSKATLCSSTIDYPTRTNNRISKYREVDLCPVPVTSGSLSHIYFHNIIWDGKDLKVVRKREDAPTFDSFETYRDYLFSVARRLGSNASHINRRFPVSQLATISSGYDSAAAAVVAREAGCTEAATISHARAVIPRSDSGAPIAKLLGMSCTSYPRIRSHAQTEIYFWAPLGSANDLNFSVLDTPEPVCLLFTGVFGGEVWTSFEHMHPDNMKFAAVNGLGLSEYRLTRGIIHCPVPFWGFHRASDLWALTYSIEMDSWRLGTNYDRPIPRRLLEEAGVPRDMFGQKKSATQLEESFEWPYTTELQADYKEYLHILGLKPPIIRARRLWNLLDRSLILPLEERLGLRWLRKCRANSPKSQFLFQWANHELADLYSGRV
jgi:hypothetical protein